LPPMKKAGFYTCPFNCVRYNSVNVFLKNIVRQNNFLLNEDIR